MDPWWSPVKKGTVKLICTEQNCTPSSKAVLCISVGILASYYHLRSFEHCSQYLMVSFPNSLPGGYFIFTMHWSITYDKSYYLWCVMMWPSAKQEMLKCYLTSYQNYHLMNLSYVLLRKSLRALSYLLLLVQEVTRSEKQENTLKLS